MSEAYEVVRRFEAAMAAFTGARHAVSVESCSAALFLCCVHRKAAKVSQVQVPAFTYPSVPAAVVHAGGRVQFTRSPWQNVGRYSLWPLGVIDSAKRISRNMVDDDARDWCLSFHDKKVLPIGRGGMILTNDDRAAAWYRCARFDGRHERELPNDTLAMAGWNMYMTPEQAARGLQLMGRLGDDNITPPDEYQNLSQYSFFTEANR